MDHCSDSRCIIPAAAKLVLLLGTLFLTGCVTVGNPPITSIADTLTTCRALYQEIDAIIDREAVRDHGSSPVRGFPYLRTTRLLASLRDELTEPAHWPAWIDHMAKLDAQARALELRNLSAPIADYPKDSLLYELSTCREQLMAADLTQSERRARLRNVAHVEDDYVAWWQVLGLYPLTAPIMSAGISAWHNKTRNTFSTELASLPVAGRLVRWVPRPLANSRDSTPLA